MLLRVGSAGAVAGASRHGPREPPVRRNERRHEFVRARSRVAADGEIELEPLTGQESHMVVRAAQADALLSVEPGAAELPAGATIEYLPLGLP